MDAENPVTRRMQKISAGYLLELLTVSRMLIDLFPRVINRDRAFIARTILSDGHVIGDQAVTLSFDGQWVKQCRPPFESGASRYARVLVKIWTAETAGD